MRDLLFPEGPPPADPVRAAQRAMRPSLPSRFYRSVSLEPTESGFAVTLDGRPVRTPGRRPVAMPTAAAAALLAAEWDAQRDVIDPATMPLTRLANTALDHGEGALAALRADIARYAGSDLLCYRAAEPAGLVALQRQLWDPPLADVEARLAVRFRLIEGVMFVEQPPATRAAVEAWLADETRPLALAALHGLTTLAGSVILVLHLVAGGGSAAAVWRAAELDEAWNRAQWGEDAEAVARSRRREADFLSMAAFHRALDDRAAPGVDGPRPVAGVEGNSP